MKKTLFLLPVIMIMALGLTGLSCGKKASEKVAEKAIEQATNGQANVDVSNNTVNVTTNEGSWQAGDDVSLPNGFPDDIYVVDGNITTAITAAETNGFTVSIEASQSVNDLKVLYDQKLRADGWEITFTMAVGDGANIGGQKGDRTVSVGISAGDEGKSAVVISTYESTQ